MISVDIVVARYNEDVAWTRALPVTATVKVYNKGPPLVGTHVLPNVGREGHTYLHHIVHNYERLSDITLFLQGRIDDHVPRPAQAVHEWIEQVSANGFTHPVYAVPADFEFRHLSYFGKRLTPADMSFGQWFTKFVGSFPKTPTIPFYKNGLFGVSKHVIMSRPKSHYQALLQNLSASEDPEVGHYLERSWLYIFNIQ